MCVHDSGVLLTEPGGARNRGSGRGWEGRGAGVREERRGKVSEDGVSMEEGEGLGIRLKGRGFEDRVSDATSVGDGEVTPDQGLTSSAFAFVRGGVGDGTVNEV